MYGYWRYLEIEIFMDTEVEGIDISRLYLYRYIRLATHKNIYDPLHRDIELCSGLVILRHINVGSYKCTDIANYTTTC